ncbi:ABC transporter substrate-binding protein [Yinghuangia sp. ASG 101]|uniref:ABC transporter substrate-binding protein n=1 Tax=Yinghuangia sp. ASG 101 TaxID=2896848 RepID=UPI001E343050|nr:ABC transporter substrate-binding protein [Yinghuangia sp. ASG 101]UGQ13408.1 ABC transporter substrate-binding protein [Yinghuangia sp. ASG 101]
MYAKKFRSRMALAAATAAAALLLGACGGGSTDDGTSTGGDAGAPRQGGTLTVALQSPAQSANPRAFTDTSAVYVNRQIFDSLVDQDPKTGEILPWLASSWHVNDSATEFTFHLRDGVTFSDGTPLTADVVKANFDDILANKAKLNPAIVPVVSELTGATVVDPTTVTVTFAKPHAAFLVDSARVALAIQAPATLALPWDQRVDKVVGSGPFVLDAFGTNQITLTRRADYAWAGDSLRHTGAAHLDKIVFKVVPESSVRTGSLKSGQVDVIADVPAADIGTLRDSGQQLVTTANPGLVWGLVPISERTPLNDPNIRRALSLAINRTEVRDTVLTEDFATATSVLASTTPGYVDLGASLAYDPAQAGRLLDAAGWTRSGDGVREKDGRKLTLVAAWFKISSAAQKSLELIQAQLAKAGVDLQLLEQTGQQIVDGLKEVKYDFFWTNGTSADGDILRSSFSNAPPNYYRIPDGPLQPLLTQQLATGDPAARNQLLAQAQQQIIDQALYLPVYEQTTVLGAVKKVHGLGLAAGAGLAPLVNVWVS